MTTGELFALCRELKGMTLRDVSAATGISNPYLSQIEHDRMRTLSFRTVLVLCRFYGVSLERVAATVDLTQPAASEELPC